MSLLDGLSAREPSAIWGLVHSANALTFDNVSSQWPRVQKVCLGTVRMVLMYACQHPARSRRTPVDVPDMVRRWIPIIRGLARAHDKSSVDRCEFAMDDHLLPLMSAPVRQIREFYQQLATALEADPTIPFFVWSAVKAWGIVILHHAPDEEVKELKTALAREIADMVEKDVQPDLGAAIVGALQWRSEKSLEAIRDGVKGGAKPRLRGRESCLFLEVVPTGADEPLASVML